MKKLTQQEAVLVQLGIMNMALSILLAKRHDYSGHDDPFANFRVAPEVLGVDIVTATSVRWLDKVKRVNVLNTLGSAGQVKDESITDTLADSINYPAIIAGQLCEKYPELLDGLVAHGRELVSTIDSLVKKVGMHVDYDDDLHIASDVGSS